MTTNSCNTRDGAINGAPPGVQFPTLKVDWDLFGTYLQESNAPEAQKRELLEVLWYNVVAFVDLGFGIDSTQNAIKSAHGSDPTNMSETERNDENGLGSAFVSAQRTKTTKERPEEENTNEF